ncbi:MAG TPA: CYTH domain-containing protein [Povalibacter sp.]|jgi:adenylate cyclase
MAIEIERKFLVKSDAWRHQAESRELMRQGYLTGGSRCSIRARIAGEQAWLNIKAKRSGMTRLEFEYPIPVADATEILNELCNGPLLEKYRHRISTGSLVWEVDEFLGTNAGLIVAEIELPTETTEFARPDWLGEEVTEDERYYNFNLALKPYREWK